MRKTRDTDATVSFRRGLALLFVLALAACGSDDDNGQDSSSSSSSSSHAGGIDNADNTGGITDADWPEINVEATEPKQLHFSWTPVEDADHYELHKNPDGESGFEVVADDLSEPEATDTIAVHDHHWHDAQYEAVACMNADCSESEDSNTQFTTSAMLDAIGFVKPANSDAGDWFGWSLALSADGRTMAVGAPREASRAQGVDGDADDNDVFGAGAVYVFQLEDGLWTQDSYLKASNTEAPSENEDGDDTTRYNDRFGFSVSLSDDGRVLAVGAPFEDSGGTGVNPDEDDNTGLQTGAVYVFKRDDQGWGQHAFLKASNAEPADEEEDEDELDEDDADEDNNDEDNVEEDEPLPGNTGDRFGHRVTLSGDGRTLAATAIRESSDATGINGDEANNDAPRSGAVYVFFDQDNSWSQQAYVKPSNTFAGTSLSDDRTATQDFGESLALSTDGNTLAVGAPGDRSRHTGVDAEDEDLTLVGAGAVHLFSRDNAEWSQSAYIKPSHTYEEEQLSQSAYQQRFGTSVALTGDGRRLAVGTPGDLNAAIGIDSAPDEYDLDSQSFELNSGAVFLFRQNDDGWRETSYLKPSNTREGVRFGQSLVFARDGEHLVVGTERERSAETGIDGISDDDSANRSGAAYLFSLIDTRWREASYIKASNTDARDGFGISLGLSADGQALSVGAHREDSDSTGINGEQNDDARDAGAVYLY